MHRPKKRFGQNFLVDTQIVDHIIRAFAAKKTDAVLEIGPGQGALTDQLFELINHLHVIEIDRDLCETLRTQYPAERFTLHEGDALTIDYDSLPCSGDRWRIIGNLPYNISTPLLIKLFENKTVISDMLFMLQKEVAMRMLAAPGNKTYGRLSVIAQYHCQVSHVLDVPPSAFNPSPKVDSTVISLRVHESPLALSSLAHFERTVFQAFNQRRKTLKNALKHPMATQAFEACGIEPGIRAECLSVQDYVSLSNKLFELEGIQATE